MTLMLLWLGLALVTQIWLCLRVGRSSVALALLTFFIGFPGAVYSFVTQRGDEDTSVTRPFLANLVFTALFLFSGWGVLQDMLAAQDARQQADANTPYAAAASAHPVIVPLPPEPVAAVAAAAPEAPAPTAAASAPAVPVDPMEAFSAALSQAGVAHTASRLPASSGLPAGAAEAMQVSATPKATGGVRPAEYVATLFRCETAAACRGIAGAWLQQAGSTKRRVLQNGTLLLSLPQGDADESDLTPAAMASAFRRLEVRP